MSIDTGRQVLTDETCRFCGTYSRYMHPAGVIADSNWTCTRCGHRQHDEAPNSEQIEGD